jgi:DNA-binding NarL/FixJ family response regulator
MDPASPIRVFLVEDHTIVREGIRSLLQQYPDIQVVGEASNGDEAIAQVDRLTPSVIVMDITMPKMDGVTATRIIKKVHSEVAVLGLSYLKSGYDVEAIMRAGAFEVLPKERAVADLHDAILKAHRSTQDTLV